MNPTDCEFRPQQQFGQPLGPGDYLIFQAQVLKLETVVSFWLKMYYWHKTKGILP